MVVVLDLGAFVNFKAHAREHVDDLILDQRDRVQAAGGVRFAGQRDVHGFGRVARFQLRRGDIGGEGFVHALGPDLAVVDELARRGAVLFGHVAQAFGQAGHGAVLAQVFLPEIGQLLLVVHGGTVGFELCAQGADLFFHCAPSFCFLPVTAGERSGRQQKKAPSLKRSGTKPCKQTSSAVPPVFRRKSGGAQDCRNGAGPVPHYCAGKKAFPAGRSGANFRAGTPGAAFSR